MFVIYHLSTYLHRLVNTHLPKVRGCTCTRYPFPRLRNRKCYHEETAQYYGRDVGRREELRAYGRTLKRRMRILYPIRTAALALACSLPLLMMGLQAGMALYVLRVVGCLLDLVDSSRRRRMQYCHLPYSRLIDVTARTHRYLPTAESTSLVRSLPQGTLTNQSPRRVRSCQSQHRTGGHHIALFLFVDIDAAGSRPKTRAGRGL